MFFGFLFEDFFGESDLALESDLVLPDSEPLPLDDFASVDFESLDLVSPDFESPDPFSEDFASALADFL